MSDKKKKRVIVAMSGGVDSSVAAAMLKEEGYDVIGVTMHLWDYYGGADNSGATKGGCCTLEDANDARKVADKLGIPFYVLNMEEEFSRSVVDYFVDSYLIGETPNPCVKCNQVLKFDVLLRKTLELDGDYLATGHYAQIKKDGNGKLGLHKGRDLNKDQSYFLFTMSEDEMSKVLFPLGDMTKAETRDYARKLGLATAEKSESQEICFVEGGKYGEFIEERLKSKTQGLEVGTNTLTLTKAGDIVTVDGEKLGAHMGLHNYTVGQRKGLNLNNGPWFVVALDMKSNSLIVGREDNILSEGLIAKEFHWTNGVPSKGSSSGDSLSAKIRYSLTTAECNFEIKGDKVIITFTEPQKAVTPGQAVVLYDEDRVVGGGWIEGRLEPAP